MKATTGTATKKRGRPPKPEAERRRNNLTIRIRDELRRSLEEVAALSRRSLSEEAEARLERSMAQAQLVPEVLELAYGAPLAGLILAAGEAMASSGPGEALRQALATEAKESVIRERMHSWTTDPNAFGQALRAAVDTLMHYRPEGAPAELPAATEAAGRTVARIHHDVRHAPKLHGVSDRLHAARRLLGPLADRPTPAEVKRGQRFEAIAKGRKPK